MCGHLNESEQAVLSVFLFVMLYNVVLAFTSVDVTQVCDHSNKSC